MRQTWSKLLFFYTDDKGAPDLPRRPFFPSKGYHGFQKNLSTHKGRVVEDPSLRAFWITGGSRASSKQSRTGLGAFRRLTLTVQIRALSEGLSHTRDGIRIGRPGDIGPGMAFIPLGKFDTHQT